MLNTHSENLEYVDPQDSGTWLISAVAEHSFLRDYQPLADSFARPQSDK